MKPSVTYGDKHVIQIMTPDGPIAVIRPIAEKLLQEGVISGELSGELRAGDAATVKAAIMAGGVCDFCSDVGITDGCCGPRRSACRSPGRRIEGWAACEDCAAIIRANQREALLKRCLEKMSFSKFTKGAIKELHGRFWDAMDSKVDGAAAAAAVMDYVNQTASDVPVPEPKSQSQRDLRIDRVTSVTGLTRAEMMQMLNESGEGIVISGESMLKLASFAKRIGGGPIRDAVHRVVEGPVKPIADIMPHWQRALESRFEAVRLLKKVMVSQRSALQMSDSIDLTDQAAVGRLIHQAHRAQEARHLGFDLDLRVLPTAETYSFNAETADTIMAAAQDIPRDSPLSSIETPNTGAGWFWFAHPLNLAGTPMVSDHTAALLWAWSDSETGITDVNFDEEITSKLGPEDRERLRAIEAKNGGMVDADDMEALVEMLNNAGITRGVLDRKSRRMTEPSLRFSAYVLGERDVPEQYRGKVLPSTRWYWPLNMSFNDMLKHNRRLHARDYGEGGRMLTQGLAIAGEEATMQVVSDLSLFFVMACLWFKTTVPILTKEPGKVERAARRRLQKEHKLSEPPVVQVVALRKSQRTEAAGEPRVQHSVETSGRTYHCRWIVKGHPRLQRVGPGRKDQKLIWIEAHPAGPDDKPLRKRERVFAVIR